MDALRTIDAAAVTAVGPTIAIAARTRGDLVWTGGLVVDCTDLHARAGLDRDLYAVARCVSSETYVSGARYSPAVMLSIAECILAESAAAKRMPWSLLVERTSTAYAWTRGAYGEQHGRYASTRVTPHGRGVAAARLALTGTTIARGARAWMSPRTQDGGTQGAHAIRDAVAVAREWAASGREWVGPLPGVDSYTHACFRQLASPRRADPSAFVAMVTNGRAGVSTLTPATPTTPQDAPTPSGAAVAATVAVGVALITRIIP